MKAYVVGTHLKCLTKVILMSTHSMFSWRNKENISTFWLKKKKPYFRLHVFLSDFFTFIYHKSRMTQIDSLVYMYIFHFLQLVYQNKK